MWKKMRVPFQWDPGKTVSMNPPLESRKTVGPEHAYGGSARLEGMHCRSGRPRDILPGGREI
jgi:hypothetical protein